MKARGFTLFFAALVASLALAVGLAIYDLTVRELQLSGTASQSQYAIYAADTGAECALYWDSHYNGTDSAFATSSPVATPTGLGCGGQDVAANGSWSVDSSPTAATTTFMAPIVGTTRCTVVLVAKFKDGNGVPHTVITAHGYNTCVAGTPNRLERVFQINY